MNYVPLQLKTCYSLLESLNLIEKLVITAKKLNYTSLAITDNNMIGVMEFYKACIDNDIKPIIGLEVMVNSLPIVIYCKDYLGYKNLIKISTISSSGWRCCLPWRCPGTCTTTAPIWCGML